MTDAELTRLLAIIGAVTGVTALVWEIFKTWRAEKLKLSIHVSHGYSYVIDTRLPYVEVSVDNVGKIKTTVNLVIVEIYSNSWFRRKRIDVWRRFRKDADPLPKSLEPGDQWSGVLQADANEV